MKEIEIANINEKADGYSDRMVVVECVDGVRFLISYNTLIAYPDKAGKLHRTWGGYSRISMNHLKKFGCPTSKSEWQGLPCEPIPSKYAFSFAFGALDSLVSRKVKGVGR